MISLGDSLPMIISKGIWSKTDTVMRHVMHMQYVNYAEINNLDKPDVNRLTNEL
jgi:hypothetical protein